MRMVCYSTTCKLVLFGTIHRITCSLERSLLNSSLWIAITKTICSVPSVGMVTAPMELRLFMSCGTSWSLFRLRVEPPVYACAIFHWHPAHLQCAIHFDTSNYIPLRWNQQQPVHHWFEERKLAAIPLLDMSKSDWCTHWLVTDWFTIADLGSSLQWSPGLLPIIAVQRLH